jgi:hypothetical protein
MTFLPTENIDLRENLPRFEAVAVAVAVAVAEVEVEVDDRTFFSAKACLLWWW